MKTYLLIINKYFICLLFIFNFKTEYLLHFNYIYTHIYNNIYIYNIYIYTI